LAKIVSAYGVPHTPSFVADVKARPNTETEQHFKAVKRHMDQIKPDILVMIQNDHFNTFFLDNWPTFAIGIATETSGPSDQTPDMPIYNVPVAYGLARYLHKHCVNAGFDLSSSEKLTVDHAVLVPLHFLTPAMSIPIVPIFINCLVPPLPSAQRCFELGSAIRKGIGMWHESARVSVIISGSLSLEVGGPLMDVGKTFGVPNKAWAAWILECLDGVRHDELVAAATPERMVQAGNVGGELLNWIALLGLIGKVPPDLLINQSELGNAFAAWRLNVGEAA